VTTGVVDAVAVLVDSAGQLGTMSSSARFKEDIHDMGEASRRLMQLRPVVFRYKQASSDGSKPLQYGLIAEEVAETFPELAAYGADGQVETVQYHLLPAILLNELQRQQGQIDSQQAENETLRAELDALRSAVQQMQERLGVEVSEKR